MSLVARIPSIVEEVKRKRPQSGNVTFVDLGSLLSDDRAIGFAVAIPTELPEASIRNEVTRQVENIVARFGFMGV